MDKTIALILLALAILIGILLERFYPNRAHKNKLKKFLTKYLIYFGLPLFIFLSLLKHKEIKLTGYAIFIISFFIILSLFTFILISKKHNAENKVRASLFICSVYGNTGYIGIPFAYLFFGSKGLAIASLTAVIGGIIHYSLGVFLANCFLSKKKFAILKVIKTPLIYSFSIALLLSRLHFVQAFHIPRALFAFSETAVYLAVFLIGLTLSFKKINRNILTGLLFKFLFSPIIAFFFLQFTQFSTLEKAIFLLLASTPPALINTSLAIEFNWDAEYASNLTAIATCIFLIVAFLILLVI